MSSQCIKNVTKLRTKENYLNAINVNYPTLAGIREKFKFIDTTYFNVVKKTIVDIMYAIFDSVCNCNSFIFDSFIDKSNYFTLNLKLISRTCQ